MPGGNRHPVTYKPLAVLPDEEPVRNDKETEHVSLKALFR